MDLGRLLSLISEFGSCYHERARLRFSRIELCPIGVVRTSELNVSKIVLRRNLVKGLKGIKAYSHLMVLFWMNQVSTERRSKLMVHPRGRRDIPLQGVFATRTPNRPNPIGMTVVRLRSVWRNVLVVEGLDAFDGSQVLDIKPFARTDVGRVRLPKWWRLLQGAEPKTRS